MSNLKSRYSLMKENWIKAKKAENDSSKRYIRDQRTLVIGDLESMTEGLNSISDAVTKGQWDKLSDLCDAFLKASDVATTRILKIKAMAPYIDDK